MAAYIAFLSDSLNSTAKLIIYCRQNKLDNVVSSEYHFNGLISSGFTDSDKCSDFCMSIRKQTVTNNTIFRNHKQLGC